MSGINALFKKLGPGLLFAGAAIGVSHLVWATRAGAEFGFQLIWAVLLVNLLKYPFFEFGSRYASVTGESLLEGYKKMGDWAIGAIMVMTVGTMFTIQAAVTVVTAGLTESLFPGIAAPVTWSIIILIICMLILIIGKYNLLDRLIKYIIVALSLSTVIALIIAFGKPADTSEHLMKQFRWSREGVIFLIALMGWMPAPLDLSVWNSIWNVEKQKQTKYSSLKDSLLDYNIGYIGTTFLALCFLSLGALTLYGTGTALPTQGGAFANQLINLYTNNLGGWAELIIAIAALTTMFSTTITCLDAFPRVLGRIFLIYLPGKEDSQQPARMSKSLFNAFNYWIWIFLVAAGAVILLQYFGGHMGTMVKIATVLSFLTAPLFAVINYYLVTSRHVPSHAHPGLFMKLLSWCGIIFLAGFSVCFLVVWFF